MLVLTGQTVRLPSIDSHFTDAARGAFGSSGGTKPPALNSARQPSSTQMPFASKPQVLLSWQSDSLSWRTRIMPPLVLVGQCCLRPFTEAQVMVDCEEEIIETGRLRLPVMNSPRQPLLTQIPF